MSAEELADQANRNAEAQVRLAHSSLTATQANLNTFVGQIAALSNAKLVDFFMDNARTMNGVPDSGDGQSLEETLRKMIRPDPSPPPNAATRPVVARNWLTPLLVVTALAAGGAIGYGVTNQPAENGPPGYRYSYLEEAGAHLPPVDHGN